MAIFVFCVLNYDINLENKFGRILSHLAEDPAFKTSR